MKEMNERFSVENLESKMEFEYVNNRIEDLKKEETALKNEKIIGIICKFISNHAKRFS